MAYIKQTWADTAAGGTPITAARLSHLEDGIFVVDGAVASLADVASSGSYTDLIDKPVIPSAPADIGAATAGQGTLADTAVQPADLATVATTGSYTDLLSKPTIPSTAAEIGAATTAQGALADTAIQPADLATVATTGNYTDLVGEPTLAAVATSGDYSDLTGTPTNHVTSATVTSIVTLTQTAYDALTPDANTLYVITGA